MKLWGKKAKQEQNQLARKAKLLLSRNFFEVEDFAVMSKRKAIKVLKLISRIENKKQSKDELYDLYNFIVAELKIHKATTSIAKFFGFAIQTTKQAIEITIAVFHVLCELFTFRLSLKKVFRI